MCRVLVIEDEAAELKLYADALNKAGYKVEAAESVEAAEIIYCPGRFDCIVVDFCMPGKSGIDFVRNIRKEDAKVGVVMITGNGTSQVEDLCEGLEIWSVLGKPLDMAILMRKIEEAWDFASIPKERQEIYDRKLADESTRIKDLRRNLLDETDLNLPRIDEREAM